jgi:hypothetical protein
MVVKLPSAKYYNKMRQVRRQLAAAQKKLHETNKKLETSVKKLDTLKKEKKAPKGKGVGKKSKPDAQPVQQAMQQPVQQALEQQVGQGDAHRNLSPRKFAQNIMQATNLSPSDHPDVYKQLTAYKTLVHQLLQVPKKMRMNVLERKNPTKSRVASKIAAELSVNRKSVLRERRKNTQKRQQKNREKVGVVHFLKKAPNSTPLPGKRDVTAKGQTRYSLNDTMSNLYKKFKDEHPNSTISLSSFCKQRPAYMKTIQWSDRRQCLCQHHQNGRLKLKAINQNISISRFLADNSPQDISDIMSHLPEGEVQFREWQKDDILFEGKTIKKLKLKQVIMSREQFTLRFEEEFADLREHVKRMRNQFDQMNLLKGNMPPLRHVTCQMDFSENYACRYQDEPAAAFYDRSQVTIKPMVIHYKDANSQMQHKSFVGITGEKGHSAPTTFAFLRKVVPEIQEILPNLSVIHYITDSPVSQYRNKSIVKIIAEHSKYFPGISCTWDFLESGHGKSACDGVGGSIKRFADTAVKTGVIISNADDFFQWAQSNNDKMSCISVSPGEVSVAQRMLNNAEPVKGVSKCHTVRAFNGSIFIREMSCYRECCQNNPSCPGWIQTPIKVGVTQDYHDEVSVQSDIQNVAENVVAESVGSDEQNNVTSEDVTHYEIGCTVEALYNGKLYGVQIEEYNPGNHEYQVKFLKLNRAGVYTCPKSTSSTWIPATDIVQVVEVSNVEMYEIGSVVEISYTNKVYRGQIEEFNAEQNDYYIKIFKKNKAGEYICPRSTWSTWVHVTDIIKLVK